MMMFMGEHMDSQDPNPGKQPRLPVVIRACQYDLPDGKCGQRTVARGYCSKHYRVLNRRGAFNDQRSHTLAPATTQRGIDRNMDAVRRAREKLERAAPEFAEHIRTAAKVAAQKGDSRPAERGLLHSTALAPLV